MALTQRQIAAIRTTWARVAPVPEMAAALFYGRLFRIAPQTRPLFRSDLGAQGRKLVDTLGFVVDHLDDPDALLPAARALAVRHVGYGVAAEHYAPVGEALVWTLQQMLGDGFGAAERDAWTEAYGAIAGEMVEAAYGSATA